MKRVLRTTSVLLAFGVAFAGCALFNPKKGDQGSGGAAGGGGGMDLTKTIKAPGKVPFKADTVSVGWTVTSEMTNSGSSMWAIVAEKDGKLHVEYVPYGMKNYGASAKDVVLGLVVNKEDGKVEKAVLGKKGEAGKEIGITPVPAGGKGGKQPDDTEVALKHVGGTQPAKLMVNEIPNYGTIKMWTGTSGVYKGVLLKYEAPKGGSKEIKAKPSTEDKDIGGTSVSCKKVVYDNGDENWTTDHEIVKALAGGVVMSKAGQTTTELKAIGTDAKAQLKW